MQGHSGVGFLMAGVGLLELGVATSRLWLDGLDPAVLVQAALAVALVVVGAVGATRLRRGRPRAHSEGLAGPGGRSLLFSFGLLVALQAVRIGTLARDWTGYGPALTVGLALVAFVLPVAVTATVVLAVTGQFSRRPPVRLGATWSSPLPPSDLLRSIRAAAAARGGWLRPDGSVHFGSRATLGRHGVRTVRDRLPVALVVDVHPAERGSVVRLRVEDRFPAAPVTRDELERELRVRLQEVLALAGEATRPVPSGARG